MRHSLPSVGDEIEITPPWTFSSLSPPPPNFKWEYITLAAKCKLSLWEEERGEEGYTNLICRHSNTMLVYLYSVFGVHITH